MLERVKQLQPILPDYVLNSNPGMDAFSDRFYFVSFFRSIVF